MRLVRVGRLAAARYGNEYRGLVIAVHNGNVIDVFPNMTVARSSIR